MNSRGEGLSSQAADSLGGAELGGKINPVAELSTESGHSCFLQGEKARRWAEFSAASDSWSPVRLPPRSGSPDARRGERRTQNQERRTKNQEPRTQKPEAWTSQNKSGVFRLL